MAVTLIFSISVTAKQRASFSPGVLWLDTDGNPINAHGGSVACFNKTYYWFGEEKIPGKSEQDFCNAGISCYRSTDLYNWEKCPRALGLDTIKGSDIYYGTRMERPKVLYNKRIKKYVMYFKLYPHDQPPYSICYVGVALSEKPEGPYVYHHRFLAATDKGTGDFAMVQDGDGKIYHLTVRKPDKAFVIAQLTDDGMFPQTKYKVLPTIEKETEAPAVIYSNKTYYMVGSGSTGWSPNPARSWKSSLLDGNYVYLGNPCFGKNPHNNIDGSQTYGGQITYIIQNPKRKGQYIAMFDLWKSQQAYDALYCWLPLTIHQGKIKIVWKNNWRY